MIRNINQSILNRDTNKDYGLTRAWCMRNDMEEGMEVIFVCIIEVLADGDGKEPQSYRVGSSALESPRHELR